MTRFLAPAIVGFAIVAGVGLSRLSQPIAPAGDTAVLENYSLRASNGTLLVGPYSRFQWHHPGPLYFYLQAPFYALAGHRTAGLNAGALAINLVALLIMVWTGLSGAGSTLAIAITAACVLYALRAEDLLTSAWNPHVVVLPAMALAVVSAAVASGRVWLLPLVVLLATFVAQTHVGVLSVAALVSVVSLAIVVFSVFVGSEGFQRVSFWRAAAASLILLLVVWAVPFFEQLTRTPGNLTQLWEFFVRGDTPGQPFRTAFAVWADMLSGLFRPSFYLAHGWVLRRTRSAWPQAWAITQMVSLVALAVAAARTRRRFHCWLALLLLAVSLTALWSVTRVEGDIMDHEVFWISGLGALNVAVFAEGLLLAWRGDLAVTAATVWRTCAVLLGIAAAAGISAMADVRLRSLGPGAETAAIRDVSQAIQDFTRAAGIERPLVEVDQSTWGLAAGVLLQMQKAGVEYAVEDDWLPMFTDAAAATGREKTAIWIAGAERHFLLRSQPGTIVIAERDPVFADAVTVGSDHR